MIIKKRLSNLSEKNIHYVQMKLFVYPITYCRISTVNLCTYQITNYVFVTIFCLADLFPYFRSSTNNTFFSPCVTLFVSCLSNQLSILQPLLILYKHRDTVNMFVKVNDLWISWNYTQSLIKSKQQQVITSVWLIKFMKNLL